MNLILSLISIMMCVILKKIHLARLASDQPGHFNAIKTPQIITECTANNLLRTLNPTLNLLTQFFFFLSFLSF